MDDSRLPWEGNSRAFNPGRGTVPKAPLPGFCPISGAPALLLEKEKHTRPLCTLHTLWPFLAIPLPSHSWVDLVVHLDVGSHFCHQCDKKESLGEGTWSPLEKESLGEVSMGLTCFRQAGKENGLLLSLHLLSFPEFCLLIQNVGGNATAKWPHFWVSSPW